MVRNKINKNLQKSGIISKRHSGVLLEDLDSKMDLILEGHQVLNEKFDDLDEKVESLDKKVDTLDKKVDTLDKKVDTLDKKVDTLDKKVDTLDKKVDTLDKKVDTLEKKVDTLDKKVDTLDKKVDTLDKKVDRNHQEFREFRNEVNYKFEVVFDKLHLIGNELKEKVSRDEFVFLEKRVTALEKSKK